jgi:hypothetical protein
VRKGSPPNESGRPDGGGGGATTESAGAPEESTAADPWLRCRRCGARITHERDRIAVNGAHRHEFMNPAGMRFVVGCFGRAIGTVGVGECSSVWTWFPGYAWQADACGSCGAHVGWCFRPSSSVSDEDASASPTEPAFHGLILEELG